MICMIRSKFTPLTYHRGMIYHINDGFPFFRLGVTLYDIYSVYYLQKRVRHRVFLFFRTGTPHRVCFCLSPSSSLTHGGVISSVQPWTFDFIICSQQQPFENACLQQHFPDNFHANAVLLCAVSCEPHTLRPTHTHTHSVYRR